MLTDQSFPRNAQVIIGHEMFYDPEEPVARFHVSLPMCQRFRRLQSQVTGLDFRLMLDEKFSPEFSAADFSKYLVALGLHFVEIIIVDRVTEIKAVNGFAGLSDLIWAPSIQCMQNFVFRDRTSCVQQAEDFMRILEHIALDIQGFDRERFRRIELQYT